jgi:hypothetical protein
MVWVKFLRNYSYKPNRQVTQDYQRNTYANVTSPCASAAVSSGAAVEETPPNTHSRATVKAKSKPVESDAGEAS